MSDVDLYPAIDIRSGRVVRLTQGDYDQETVYGDDPVEVARRFTDEGARWVHIVDLDAARSGDPVNRTVISEIASALSDRARVQTGGGVRSIDDARALSDAGISRVVMGSAAVSNPELVEEAARIVDVAVGLDHRNGRVAVHGWTRDAGMTLESALDLFPAASAFVITRAAQATSIPVIASGGVSTLADIEVLAGIPGVTGIITGKAIYEGRFSVRDALECVKTKRDGS